MVIKEGKTKTPKLNIGDYVKVVRNDDRSFKCIVVEQYNGGFVGKIISKDKGVGAGSWNRYALDHDGRFQIFSECKSVEVLSHSTKMKAKSSLKLNESVTKNSLVYYETALDDGDYATFCICDGYGGWSFHDKEDITPDSLKESYFNSQLSKLNTLRESVNY